MKQILGKLSLSICGFQQPIAQSIRLTMNEQEREVLEQLEQAESCTPQWGARDQECLALHSQMTLQTAHSGLEQSLFTHAALTFTWERHLMVLSALPIPPALCPYRIVANIPTPSAQTQKEEVQGYASGAQEHKLYPLCAALSQHTGPRRWPALQAASWSHATPTLGKGWHKEGTACLI